MTLGSAVFFLFLVVLVLAVMTLWLAAAAYVWLRINGWEHGSDDEQAAEGPAAQQPTPTPVSRPVRAKRGWSAAVDRAKS